MTSWSGLNYENAQLVHPFVLGVALFDVFQGEGQPRAEDRIMKHCRLTCLGNVLLCLRTNFSKASNAAGQTDEVLLLYFELQL